MYWIAICTDELFIIIKGDKPPFKVYGQLPHSPEIITATLKQKEAKGYNVVAEWNPKDQWVPRNIPKQSHASPGTGVGKYRKHGQLPPPPPNRPVPPPPPPKPMSIIDIVQAWQNEVPPEEEWF